MIEAALLRWLRPGRPGATRGRKPQRCVPRARGATMVEYSLGIGLVALVLVGAISAVTDDAEDSLDDRGNAIGHPASEVGTTTTTSGGGGGPPSSTVPSTTLGAYSGIITGSCTGSSGNKNECMFSLSPSPAPVVPTWSMVPPTGYTGTPPVVTFTAAGDRTIRADVDGVVVQLVVSCMSNGGGKLTCNPA